MAALKKLWLRFYNERLVPFIKNTTTKRIFTSILFFLVLTAILSFNNWPYKYNFQVGTAATKTIKADRNIDFEDKKKTEEARNRAAEQVNQVHEKNPKAAQEVQAQIDDVFAKITAVQTTGNLDADAKVQKLKELLPTKLSDSSYRYLASIDQNKLQKIQASLRDLINNAYQSNISDDTLNTVTKQIKDEQISTLSYDNEAKLFMGTLIDNFMQPNIKFNVAETNRKIEEAKAAVKPVMVRIQQGEKVVGEGEIITPDIIDKLVVLGYQRPLYGIRATVGVAFLVIISIVVVLLYLNQYRRDIFENDSHLLLIGIIVSSTLLIAKAVTMIDTSGTTGPPIAGYLAPVSMASILIAILLDKKLAILITAILSIYLGIMTGNQLEFAIVSLMGGVVAVYSVSKLSRRSDLAKAGLVYISSANIVTIIAVVLITTNNLTTYNWFDFILLPLMGFANGIFSAIFAGGALPYLETAFDITSAVKLLELSNPNEPLLKQILLEAPGTYHHSIIVGNLAEAAADAIGADSLLARVGAYYHDIGKVKRPYFFIENQLTNDNPHDKLAPSLSTLIITSHIKDGVEMAREQRIPQILVDIIEQHHGTSLVTYFYYRATENDKNETVAEADYRYEGPKPQTKEAALVMLADSVEAAARAMQKPTPGRIEGLVRKVIKEKLNDGQLDECDLTFKDLDIIANAFVRILSGIFHSRIEYPENVIKEMERRKARDASLRKQ